MTPRHTEYTNAGVPRRRVTRKLRPARFPILEPCAQRLERLRFQRGLSQRALAARASISTNHYQDIAHARANFTLVVLQRLAAALSVSVAELFEPEPRPPDDRRTVPVADIEGLAEVHREFTDVVERLARQVE